MDSEHIFWHFFYEFHSFFFHMLSLILLEILAQGNKVKLYGHSEPFLECRLDIYFYKCDLTSTFSGKVTLNSSSEPNRHR